MVTLVTMAIMFAYVYKQNGIGTYKSTRKSSLSEVKTLNGKLGSRCRK